MHFGNGSHVKGAEAMTANKKPALDFFFFSFVFWNKAKLLISIKKKHGFIFLCEQFCVGLQMSSYFLFL